jgi:hypothetical protein
MHVCLLLADRYGCTQMLLVFELWFIKAIFVACYVGNGRSALPIATCRSAIGWLVGMTVLSMSSATDLQLTVFRCRASHRETPLQSCIIAAARGLQPCSTGIAALPQ